MVSIFLSSMQHLPTQNISVEIQFFLIVKPCIWFNSLLNFFDAMEYWIGYDLIE